MDFYFYGVNMRIIIHKDDVSYIDMIGTIEDASKILIDRIRFDFLFYLNINQLNKWYTYKTLSNTYKVMFIKSNNDLYTHRPFKIDEAFYTINMVGYTCHDTVQEFESLQFKCSEDELPNIVQELIQFGLDESLSYFDKYNIDFYKSTDLYADGNFVLVYRLGRITFTTTTNETYEVNLGITNV